MTVLAVIALVVWIFIVASVVLDIVRRRDLDGAQTALWIAFIVILPLVGVIVYLIARPSVSGDEEADVEAYREKVLPEDQAAAAANEIADLTRQHEEGLISDEEYERRRRELG